MNMLNVILSSTVPIFFVIALGYYAGWTRAINNTNVADLNALVMDFALPAALFVAMVKTPRHLMMEQGVLIIILGVSMLVIYSLHTWIQLSICKLDLRQASVNSLTTALPNVASAGMTLIAILLTAAGE